MKRPYRLLLAAVCIVVTGCATAPGTSAPAGAASSSADGASSVEGATDLFTAPAEPLDLTVTAEPDSSVTAEATRAGGTLTATGADGTTFELDIPPDALLGTVDITMTPVADIEGWPEAPGNSAAVLMEPDGLTFLTPARLTITPSEPIEEEAGMPFSFYADGDDTHIVLPVPGAGGIVIPVEHFSGKGFVWNVQDSFWVTLQRYQQQQVEDRLQHRMGLEGKRIIEELKAGRVPDKTFTDLIIEHAAEWERDVINRRLQLASSSCKDAKHALSGYSAWNRTMALLELVGYDLTPPPNLLNLARYVCAEEATEECFETGDVERLASILLSDAKSLAVQGATTGGDTGAYLDACDRFELQVEEYSEHDIGNGAEVLSAELTMIIPLRFVPTAGADASGLIGATEGEAHATFVSGEGTMAYGACSVTMADAVSHVPFKARLLRVEFINTGPEGDTIRLKDIKLEFLGGLLKVNTTFDCQGQTGPLGPRDLPVVFTRHQMASEGGVTITGWEPDGHPVIATKTFEHEPVFGGPAPGKGKEILELTLVHTPGPMPPRPNLPNP